MFSILKKKKSADINLPSNLTRTAEKEIRKLVENAQRDDDGIPRTAQQSIPFQRMFPDGICRVNG